MSDCLSEGGALSSVITQTERFSRRVPPRRGKRRGNTGVENKVYRRAAPDLQMPAQIRGGAATKVMSSSEVSRAACPGVKVILKSPAHFRVDI